MRKIKDKYQHLATDKAVTRIVRWILLIQNKFANIMNNTFQHTSAKRMKIILVLFCLISGGISIYYFYDAVANDKKKNDAVTIEGFVIPKNSIDREVEALPNVFVDEETWNKVQSFKIYMDSIKTAEPIEYQKVLTERPGLMDSIKQLEGLYYSQKIK